MPVAIQFILIILDRSRWHIWRIESMSDQFVFRHVFHSNFVLPGQMAKRIISSGAQKYYKSNLHSFSLYINTINSYSFKTAVTWTEQNSQSIITILNERIFTHNSSWFRHAVKLILPHRTEQKNSFQTKKNIFVALLVAAISRAKVWEHFCWHFVNKNETKSSWNLCYSYIMEIKCDLEITWREFDGYFFTAILSWIEFYAQTTSCFFLSGWQPWRCNTRGLE